MASTIGVAAFLCAAPALADEPEETVESHVAVVTEIDGLGPIDVRVTWSGYRVRLDHRQVEALIEMSDYAEFAAEWTESDLVATAVWLVRLQLSSFCAAGDHDGVEVAGTWSDLPSISPR